MLLIERYVCLFLMCYNVMERSAVCDDYFDLSIQ